MVPERVLVMPKRKWEVDAKDRLLGWLRESRGQDYTATGEDVVTNSLTGRDYDYELTPNAKGLPIIALEIFRIVGDERDLAHHNAWGDVVSRLTAELNSRGVTGYFIRTPHFNISKSKRKQFASETAERIAAVIAAHADQAEFDADGYAFYKLTDNLSVRFSYIGGVRQINPFGSISEALDDLLPTKNEQLNTQGRLRALLILNVGIFPNEEHDVREYFSTKNLEEFSNIDRVFFEIAPGNIALVFDRRVFDSYRDEKLPEDDELGVLFFPFVEHRLLSDQTKAFGIVKTIGEKYGNLNRLSVYGKDALISCGERFAREEDWPSVLWIVEQLRDDADPAFPNSMHEVIAKGEDYHLIVSVRGRLCWLIQKVVVYNLIDHYSSMLDILEGYAFGQDFYMRSQACVPLSEMAVRRRQKLPNGNRFMPENIAERIKTVGLRMLRDAGSNPALLDDVSNILGRIGDFTEAEAADVIDRLSVAGDLNGIHNRCGLLLYFALFRGSGLNLPHFDTSKFQERLHQELKNGDSQLRVSLIWQMSGGADGAPYPCHTICPYLTSFLSGEYSDAGFLHLRRICEAYIQDHGDEICPIVVGALSKVAEYIAAEPDQRGWNITPRSLLLERARFNLKTRPCGVDGGGVAVLPSLPSTPSHV
jgi:hypothetical protein